MNFGELATLSYEYVGDASQTITRARVNAAINNAYRDLALLVSTIDPTFATVIWVPVWNFSAGSEIMIEAEFPDDFHRIVGWVVASGSWGPSSNAAHSGAGEILPFREWVRYSGDNWARNDVIHVAYIRHSESGVTPLTTVKRLKYGVTGSTQAITSTIGNNALGVHRDVIEVTASAISAGLRVLYVRKMVDMQDDDEVPIFPEEFHEAIAVAAALRLAVQDNDPIFKDIVGRLEELKGTMGVALKERSGGVLVA